MHALPMFQCSAYRHSHELAIVVTIEGWSSVVETGRIGE